VTAYVSTDPSRAASPCSCDSPIPYRDPGQSPSCAKCGRWLEPRRDAATAPRAKPRRAKPRDSKRRKKPEISATAPSTDPAFEWPFADAVEDVKR